MWLTLRLCELVWCILKGNKYIYDNSLFIIVYALWFCSVEIYTLSYKLCTFLKNYWLIHWWFHACRKFILIIMVFNFLLPHNFPPPYFLNFLFLIFHPEDSILNSITHFGVIAMTTNLFPIACIKYNFL